MSGLVTLLHRIYCELELNLRIGPRKRLKRLKPDGLVVPEDSNQTWSMDFMQDQLADGRKFRTLDVFHEDYAGALSLQANVISKVLWPRIHQWFA